MSTITKYLSILFSTLTVLCHQPAQAQDKLSWLDDYTGEIPIGSDTYQYSFTNVEGNDCKLKIEEKVTGKKGTTEVHFWIFYLSDIDPSGISFKSKGKALVISLETLQSQKFISYYEEGEMDEYTEEIIILMNEVDMVRSFLETMKERITNCKETETAWENRDQAFTWLMNNVEKATDEDTEWDQKFKQGKQSYLVDFQANSMNDKGEQELFNYTFDLSDINPLAINLKISGKSLMVEVPVKEDKRFIKVISPTATEFTNELLIYANNIELARQIVHAFKYLVTNTIPERPQWDSYGTALGFVKENLGEAQIDDELFSNSITYEVSPTGMVNLIIGESDSDGTSEEVKYAFYLSDIMDKLNLVVSKKSITIEMETKNKREFIRETTDEKVTDYSSALGFHVSEIDMARNMINAFEYAILNSEEEIKEFSNISEVGFWFSENIGLIETDGDKYEQYLSINEEHENQLIIEKKLNEADGGTTETRYILYPEDISLDELEIEVSGKKLAVPLETEKGKYIKQFENGKLQYFTGSAEIMLFDPLVAKNFMAAIRFLKADSKVEERAAISKEKAIAFLSGNIQKIELPDEQHEQKLEIEDEGNCKMNFTRVETDDKGASEEYLYEFFMSDIHPDNSELSVKGKLIEVSLVTRGNEKLIKPYKNGEADDFDDEFIIYVDDVMIAKKTLAAFAALSEGCK